MPTTDIPAAAMPESAKSGARRHRKSLDGLLKAALLCLPILAGCATEVPNLNPRAAQPQTPAAHVDLDRYMGRWYIIANIPYFAERGKVGSYVEYSRREDGRINDWYFGRDQDFNHPLKETKGIATVQDTASNARWSVRFIWPFSADYLILYVDPDYRYAVIGHPSKNYAWIFARDIYVSDQDYQSLLDVLDTQGYDTFRMIRVPQRPEFLGIPGYG